MYKKLFASGACAALAACNTLQAQSRVDPQTVAIYPMTLPVGKYSCVGQIPGDVRLGALDLDCLRFPGETALAYMQASRDRGARNRLAAILMKQSDDVCTVEMGRLTANQAMVNTGLSFATTAFGTAGSIVTGQLAGNILSGLASGTNATRDHINAEIYRNALSTAVTKAIRQERGHQRTAIEANFSKQTPDYSVDQMVLQVNRYHQVCSFFTGLDLVLKAVDRQGLYRNDPRRVAAFAIENVRAQIASINRQLSRPDLPAEERTELLEQRTDLRRHETALVKSWTALPVAVADPDTSEEPNPAPEPQPEPQPEPVPEPAPDSGPATNPDPAASPGPGHI